MSGVGGYMRRCERKPARAADRLLPPPYRSLWIEPPTFQTMPILRFEPFDVRKHLDSPDMPRVRS